MNRPTYDDIARQARKLWEERGRPPNADKEIWLEAERVLAGSPAAPPAPKAGSVSDRASAATAAESMVEFNISPAVPEQEAIRAAVGQPTAAASRSPAVSAPKAKAPPSEQLARTHRRS